MLDTQLQRGWKELNGAQLVCLKTISRHRLLKLMMPRQVGKTHFGCWLNREVMRQNTNVSTLFLAKDFPSITRATKEKFAKLFPEDEFRVSAISGISHLGRNQKGGRGSGYMSGVDKVPDKLRGGTMGLIHWSEVAFSKFEAGTSFEDVYQQITLPMISRTRGLYLMESTPNGKNFWYHFWEEDKKFRRLKFDVDFCINVGAITREEVDFLEQTMHPDVFDQEMNCNFVTFTGRVYSEYEEKHLDTEFVPLPHEYVVVGIDIGFSGSASTALFGCWREGKLHIFDQVYGTHLRIGQFADKIEERMQAYKVERHRYVAYTDHDPEMVDELTQRRIKVTLADKVDAFACRLSIKEGLYADKVRVSHIRCPWLHREIQAAAWSDTRSDEMEMKGDPNGYHWDSEAALRYLWRGARVELEKPIEMPKGLDTGGMVEWKAKQAKREAKEASSSEAVKVKPGQAFEF
jgi:hypothetical protein